MASVSAGTKVEKPSWSKIAAAGLKPPSTQQNPINDNTQKHEIPSSPRNGANFVAPSNGPNPSSFTPKQKKLVPFAPKDLKEVGVVKTDGPQVRVQNAEPISPPGRAPRALDGMLMPTTDEASTQISSSTGSGKPPSLDGKSVTSGTTFALDEKESLRPDDSASVKATDDEDPFSQAGPGLPDSRTGSDDGVRAFRDQLREISSMEPSRHTPHSQSFIRGGNHGEGVLYIPPQGSGVGIVPVPTRPPVSASHIGEVLPDSKLLEALDSPKDRIMVLKLEQDIVDFVKDAKESSLKLPQTNAFYRMLAHKLADYYGLGHVVDESTMAVQIYKTPNCRLPPPLTGIATPSTAASTPPPSGQQMKILRRGDAGPVIANGSNTPSKTASENGDYGNEGDRRSRLPASREEREARYEAARKRIMGSVQASESQEEPPAKEDSRSSSAAGRKSSKKKHRADSDDDFEARSAYSAYYPATYSSGNPTPAPYGYPNIVDSQSGHCPPDPYSIQAATGSYQHYEHLGNNQWSGQDFQTQDSTSNWMHAQQPGYDLSGQFQRAMTFQPSPMPHQSPNMQQTFNHAYGQPTSTPQQQWQTQTPFAPGYSSQSGSGFAHGYPNRPTSASNQFLDSHGYAFGQLPSQTFPGRPANRLEHPLPGSYKGKHFNPQSQSFIPSQVTSVNTRPFTPQGATTNNVAQGYGYGTSNQLQQQASTPSQIAACGQQHQAVSPARPPRGLPQPMVHPLPQPVFPRQPSPNVPLPPKPEATPPRSTDRSVHLSSTPAHATTNPGHSSIAKWGAPASLPAKPPPPAESGRIGGMPSFGSMPPMNSGGYGVNGQGR